MDLREELTEHLGLAFVALAQNTRDEANQSITELVGRLELLEASVPRRGEMLVLANEAQELLRAGQQTDGAAKLWRLWKIVRDGHEARA